MNSSMRGVILFLAAITTCNAAESTNTATAFPLKGVVISTNSFPVGQDDQFKRTGAVLKTIDDKRYYGVSTRNWRQAFDTLAAKQVAIARSNGMDAASLMLCMEKVKTDAGNKKAFLPVYSECSPMADEKVWLIGVIWELASERTFGHVCVYVFRARDGERIAFDTCM
jgi:hypothetical protein